MENIAAFEKWLDCDHFQENNKIREKRSKVIFGFGESSVFVGVLGRKLSPLRHK